MQPKVVLLTGASSGIGWEVAKLLLSENIKVYAASRNPEKTQNKLNSIPDISTFKGKIIPVKMDVNNEQDTQEIITRILKDNATLDAVVCNAGNGLAGSIEDTSIKEIKYQFETNFYGAIRTIQACLPIFRRQKQGKIIVTSSIAAFVPLPYQAFYSASKSALKMVIEALYMETKSFNIQCCSVLPGDTKTSFTSQRKYTEQCQSADSCYKENLEKAINKMQKDELHGMEAKFIAKKIVSQLMRKKMKINVIPGFQYKMIYFAYHILPSKLKLWAVKKLY